MKNIFRIATVVLTGFLLVNGVLWAMQQEAFINISVCESYGASKDVAPQCVQLKKLKIPKQYEGDGYWLNISGNGEGGSIATLLKAVYPTMKPWQSIYWWKRSEEKKIEIQIKGFGRAGPLENKDAFFLGSPKAEEQSESISGLHAYKKDGHLILVPFDSVWRIGIECTNGDYPKSPASGLCWAYANNEKNMLLFYTFPQDILPEWKLVNERVFFLVESFIQN